MRFRPLLSVAVTGIAALALAGCMSDPIVITPSVPVDGQVLLPSGNPAPSLSVSFVQLQDGETQYELAVTATAEDGTFRLDLPRHASYDSKFLLTTSAVEDTIVFYGFVTAAAIQIDLSTTVVYELLQSFDLPLDALATTDLASILERARTTLAEKLAKRLIQVEGNTIKRLRRAYQNALAADTTLLALIDAAAVRAQFNTFGYLPYGRDNRTPTLVTASPTILTPSVAENSQLDLEVSGQDPDSDLIFYVWESNGDIIASGSFKHSYFPPYESVPWNETFRMVPVSLTMSDGGKQTKRTWNAVVSNVPRAPVFSTSAPLTANEEQIYYYVPAASSPDEAPFHIELTAGIFPIGADLCLSTTGLWQNAGTACSIPNQLMWTPTNCQTASAQTFQLRAVDAIGTVGLQNFNVTSSDLNTNPAITSSPAALTGTELQLWTYQLLVTDPQADPVGQPGIVSGSNPNPFTYSPGGVGCADVMKFRFIRSPPTATIDEFTGAISWSPTDDETGNQRFEIEVSDQHGATSRQDFIVVVQNTEREPLLFAPTGGATIDVYAEAYAATPYLLTFRPDDPDSEDRVSPRLTTTVTGLPTGSTLDLPTIVNQSRTLTWPLTDADTPSNWPLSITICDTNPSNLPIAAFFAPIYQVAQHLCLPETVTLNAPKRNFQPLFTTVAIPVATGLTAWTYNLEIQDLNTTPPDTLTFTLPTGPAGMTLTPTDTTAPTGTATLSWTPNNLSDLGPQLVSIRVCDGNAYPGGAHCVDQDMSLFVLEKNFAPSIISVAVTPGQNASVYTYDVNASDPNTTAPNNSLIYSLVEFPTGMTINPDTGVITWIPTTAQAKPPAGNHNVRVRVSDGANPPLSADQTYTIVLSYINTAPVFDQVPAQIIGNSLAFSLDILAFDYDGDAYTLTGTAVPPGSTFTDNGNGTGLFTWTPDTDGSYTLTVQANGTPAGPVTLNVPIQVTSAPVFLSTPVIQTTVDAAYRYEVHVMEPTGTGVSILLDSGPAGMTVSQTPGTTWATVQWTPSASYAGSSAMVSLRATSGTGGMATQDYSLYVRPGFNAAPTLTGSIPTGTATVLLTEGRKTNFSVTATDGDGDPRHYSWFLGTTWIGDGTSSFDVRPSSSDAGPNTVKCKITDGTGTTERLWNVRIRDSIPVISQTRTLSATPIHQIAPAWRAGKIAAVAGATVRAYIMSLTTFADTPSSSGAVGFTPTRLSLKNDYGSATLITLFFTRYLDPIDALQSYQRVDSDTLTVTPCPSCFTDAYQSTFFQAGGAQTGYDPGTGRTFWISAGNRRYLSARTSTTQHADIDLGAGVLGVSLVFDPVSDQVFVTSPATDSVIAVNATTRTVVGSIPLPAAGGSGPIIADSATGKVWVWNTTAGSITEISAVSLAVASTSTGIPAVAAFGNDPAAVMTLNSIDSVIYLVNPAAGTFMTFDLSFATTRSVAAPGAQPSVVYYDGTSSTVIGAAHATGKIYQLK